MTIPFDFEETRRLILLCAGWKKRWDGVSGDSLRRAVEVDDSLYPKRLTLEKSRVFINSMHSECCCT
jgi:hypothetical protein